MADEYAQASFQLAACRELLEAHPESLRIREQVEALENAMPDRPGIVVSFCRSIIETTCKTILNDRSVKLDNNWKAPRLASETIKCLNVSTTTEIDSKLQNATKSLFAGLSQIIDGVVQIRNAHGSAAHGADAYAPLLDSRYAEILARSTDAVVGLLFRTHLQSAHRDPLTRFSYEEHADFNEYIDNGHSMFEVLETPLLASEALYRTDFQAYRAALVQFKQEQAMAENDTGEEGA
ncbi:abortive infection family protein [Halomonas sp. PR-M31]|uniref:abortive infection family protein n=1 Tax=Halomonas sp. PR-M31 TaxID=1471202 RepID=UPI00065087A5|nr:abortive infection family protein [Halomonas sp. PR-M31]